LCRPWVTSRMPSCGCPRPPRRPRLRDRFLRHGGGGERIVDGAPRLEATAVTVGAGRLGSGNLGALAASPRRILGAGRTRASAPWEKPPGPGASKSDAAGHEGRHSSARRRDSHGRRRPCRARRWQ
jgi:hypothetical protein